MVKNSYPRSHERVGKMQNCKDCNLLSLGLIEVCIGRLPLVFLNVWGWRAFCPLPKFFLPPHSILKFSYKFAHFRLPDSHLLPLPCTVVPAPSLWSGSRRFMAFERRLSAERKRKHKSVEGNRGNDYSSGKQQDRMRIGRWCVIGCF